MNWCVRELFVLRTNYINPYHDLIRCLLFNCRGLDFVMVGSAYISMDQSKGRNALAASGEGSGVRGRGVALQCNPFICQCFPSDPHFRLQHNLFGDGAIN